MNGPSPKALQAARGEVETRRPRPKRAYVARVPAKQSTAIIQTLNAAIASHLLACFVLDCCIRLSEQRHDIQPCRDTIARLTAARREARRLQQRFDPSDTALVQQILAHYGPGVPYCFIFNGLQ
jgi:hypothetical protein